MSTTTFEEHLARADECRQKADEAWLTMRHWEAEAERAERQAKAVAR